ncbi:hypothetical protein HELRODRAFT_166525 [Helobdella robusta]|uniref:G-protein coupled receptors family 1 profile domain-containing protein n=1 Tax=Helobdella robusta TaxID=6412 RepID=T1EY75_HELRO|nr:hypothetical protein HELRODRAFT_166525 [Helobdella robusta]ESO11525.1 hypothetical protein HELRODRAFT_166525 [Helobdella robusta]
MVLSQYLYNTILFCLVIFAIPFAVLTYLNYRLVSTIKIARASWTKLNRNQKIELKAAKLPLVIVAVFFVCATQSFVSFLLDAINNNKNNNNNNINNNDVDNNNNDKIKFFSN